MAKDDSRPFVAAALLSGQLEGLISSWEKTLASKPGSWLDTRRRAQRDTGPTDPAAVIAALEAELADLERDAAALRNDAQQYRRVAADWERRAMTALQDYRSDLAKNACARRDELLTEVESLEAEVGAMTEAAEGYRRALATLRADPAVDT